MSYVNGKPVGLTYSSSTNKPVGLTELSSIAVTLVSATNFSGITLSSMGDINFTGLANNYIIKWNSTTSKWEVAAQSGGGGGGFDAFGVVITPDTNVLTADAGPDTLTLDSSDNSVVITGDAGTTTVDFVVGQITTANISDIGNYATTASLNNYALNSTLTNYATTASLNSYATTASLGNYATTASLAALELDDLFDVNAPTPGNGQVLMYFTGTGNWQATSISVTGGGATTFLGLTDTPSTYSSYANSFVIVNTDNTGLAFTPPTANAVIIGDQTGSPESLGIDEFLRTTLLGDTTNVPTYKFDKTTSSVPYAWPNGTLMTYQLGTSSFNLSDPSVWWTAVAPTFSHNTLGGLTVGNPHTQYVLSSTNLALSSAVSSLQTSTINLSAYIAANEAAWASGGGSASSFSSILFVTGITPSLELGEIAWNDDYSTIDIQTSTDTTLQVGQEQVIKVRNETGDTLYNGDVVYVSGVHGTGAAKLQVAKASANTNCTIQNIVGICTQDITHNSDGFITTFGYVRNVNTSAFSIGDVVYLANTAGEYTNTQEAKPSHSIRLGTVARSHATDGVIFVKIDPGYDTTFLHDVENDPPESSGQVLIWNSTSSLYQHGGHNDLTDLTVGNPHTQYATLSGATFTGQIQAPIVSATTVSAGTLHVGGSDGYIKNNNGNIFISAINGTVIIPSLSSSQFTTVSSNLDSHIASASVHYPSSVITSWVGSNFASSVHNHALSSLSDTQIASVVDGQTIIWSGAANRWVNTTPSEGVTDHALLTGLLSDTAHPQYVLSSTNSSLSSLVSNIEASTIALSGHITLTDMQLLEHLLDTGNVHPQYASSSLSATISSHTSDGTIHFTSGTVTDWVLAQNYASSTQLSNYVLTSTNNALSSLVSNIEASTIGLSGHITLTDMQLLGHLLDTGNVHPQYATLSGATFSGNILAPSVSATALSATTVNGGNLATAVYTSIQNGDTLIWNGSTSAWNNSPRSLSGLTDVLVSATPIVGQVLIWNGTQWDASTSPAGVTNHSLLSNLTANDHPQYASSSLSATISSHTSDGSIHYASSVLTSWAYLNTFTSFIGGESEILAVDAGGQLILNSGDASLAFTNPDPQTIDITVNEAAVNHNILSGLTTGHPHTQYVLSSTNNALSSLVSNIQTSTIGLSSYIAANEGSWGGGGGALSSLSDVSGNSIVNKDILIYNSSIGRWTNVPVMPMHICVHADATTNITLTNQPNTEQFLGNSNRNIFKADLSDFTQVRILARVITGSVSVNTPRVYARYNSIFVTAIGSFNEIGATPVSASLTTADFVVSPWIDLVADAKQDVYVTVAQHGGDGTADPALGPVSLQFR